MPLSTEAIWDEMKRLCKAHSQVIIAFAGVFMFLPGLAGSFFLDPPKLEANAIDAMAQELNAWMRANWVPLVMQGLISSFGSAMIYRYVLSKTPATAQRAIIETLPLLPVFVLANLVTSVAIALGIYLLVFPGIYLIGRVLLVAPIIAAEGQQSLVAALTRSMQLTRGMGWRLAGMLVLLVLVTFIVTMVGSVLLSVIAHALLPEHAVDLVRAAIGTVQMTIINLAGLIMAAATYRLTQEQANHPWSKGM